MNTIKNDVQDINFPDPETKAQERPALEGMFISKSVRKDVDFAYHYAHINIKNWSFVKERLLSKIVIELNREFPRFKSWLEANGYLLNTHLPGRKLTVIKGVYKDKRSNYYCYSSTHLF